jgi:cysteine desulfuration protein SufE
MKTIQQTLEEISADFEILPDPKDKFVQLLDLGKQSSGLPYELKTEQNKIYGCMSQAWVVGKKQPNLTFVFQTDSDALIVKGLLRLLEMVLNNRMPEEIKTMEAETLLNSLGLGHSITSQRTHGFASALHKIKLEILK